MYDFIIVGGGIVGLSTSMALGERYPKARILVLEKENQSAIEWFKITDMIVNPDKFQVMILSWDKKENRFEWNINDSITSSEKCITLSVV